MRVKLFQDLIDVLRGKLEFNFKDPNRWLSILAIGEKFIYRNQDSNDLILRHLNSDKPEMICRFGTLELETVRHFFKYRNKKNHFIDGHRKSFSNTAGFFPVDDYNMTRFACLQLNVLKHVDIMCCRCEAYEIEIVEKYLNQDGELADILAISQPFCFENPWTSALKGKKVLVINPFDETIKKQYAKRELLFKDQNVLPEFELITYRPVQGIGHSKDLLPYKNWFEALDAMKADIKNIDFDIAIIGAGAYGMFLAQYCKSLGKKAVHMGGATQLLFGIKGKRWDNYLNSYYNQYWTRPSASETPAEVELFENGTMAYW